MRLCVEQKLIAILLLLPCFIILIARETYTHNKQHSASIQKVKNTEKILLLSEKIGSGIKDLERGVRGYVITGDDHLLQPYYNSKKDVFENVEQLRQLSADNAGQQRHIDTLQFYLVKKVNFLQNQLQSGQCADVAKVKELLVTYDGVFYMDKMLNALTSIQSEEQGLLREREAASVKNNKSFDRFFFMLIGGLLIVLILLFVTLWYNLVKRRRAEAGLSDRKNELQSIIDNTSSLIYIKDIDGRYTLVNKQFEKSIHLSGKDIIGKTVYELYEKPFADIYRSNDQKVIKEKKVIEAEEDTLVAGELLHYYSVKFPLCSKDGKVYAVAGISSNITELVQKRQLEKQKQIAQTTILAQEKERAEIGKELHDNVNQLLATAKLMVETAISIPEYQEVCLSKSKLVLSQAIDEVRNLSHSLVAPSFKQRSLQDALEEIKNQVSLGSDLTIELVLPHNNELEQIRDELKLALYRIIQEQVTNTLKYAQASEVWICIKIKACHMHMTIKDNGIGADMSKLSNGIGLRNIESRINYYDGEIKIFTAPFKGFRLWIKIPLAA